MSNQLIYYAITMFVSLYLGKIYLLVLLLFSLLLPKLNRIVYLLFIVFLFLFKPYSFSLDGQVIERSNTNAIVSIDKERVVLFSDELLFKGDRIVDVGEVNQVSSLDNFVGFNYASYLRNLNIVGCIQSEDVEVIKGNTLARSFYESLVQCLSFEQLEIVHSLLYGVNIDYLGSFFLISSGLHLSGLNRLLLNLFKKLKNKKYICVNVVLMGLGVLFEYKTTFMRLFIENSLRLFKLSSKQRVALTMMILMLLRPWCVFELSFLVPFGFKLIHLFNVEKSKGKLLSFVFSCFIQCSVNYQCNLVEMGLLSLYRKLNLGLYLMCLFAVFVPGCSFMLVIVRWIVSLFSFVPSFNVLSGLGIFGYVGAGLLLYAMSVSKSCVKYFVVFFMCLHFKAYLNPLYEVTFLNVGQGDSILIQAPFNTANVLIDVPGGLYNQSVEKVIVPTLRYKGIRELDYVVLTHSDSDHSGGYEDLIKQVSVLSTQTSHEDIDTAYLDLLSLNESVYDNENDNSLVYASRIGGLWYLFMGDVSKSVEVDILRKYPMLECDILKLAHHGSKTSSDDFFVKSLMPRIAIVSAGANNIYHHPSIETLDLLDSIEVRCFVTADNGAVSIKSFLNMNFVTSASKEFVIIDAR